MVKIVFLGCTKFSKAIFDEISKINEIEFQAIFSIPAEFNISYSNSPVENFNYHSFLEEARNFQIPFYEVDSKSKKLEDYKKEIESFNPDVILVMGWYYMIPKSIRDLSKYGTWGIHASLLPKYAGGAPLVWAMIEGENKTGVTLFKMSNGVDNGPIIAQESINIGKNETISEVYDKATLASCAVVRKAFQKDISKTVFKAQIQEDIQIYPQRSPEDGEINLSQGGREMFNFIRAQSSPYPGAFIRTKDNKKLYIDNARLIEDD